MQYWDFREEQKEERAFRMLRACVAVANCSVCRIKRGGNSKRTMIIKQLMCRINEEANWMHKRRIHVSYEEEDT